MSPIKIIVQVQWLTGVSAGTQTPYDLYLYTEDNFLVQEMFEFMYGIGAVLQVPGVGSCTIVSGPVL